MDIKEFNDDLLAFLTASCTPFHAVEQITQRLDVAGFTALREADEWQLGAGRYYVVRNGSSIVAFNVSDKDPVSSGFRMIGAHTDSPCLKVKPQPELQGEGYFQLGVEVYGGALLNPWFDRDLSLAGRVNFKDKSGAVCSALINFIKPIATVPSLAIHLDREANKNRTVNPQTDIPPLLMLDAADPVNFRELLLAQLLLEHPVCAAVQVLDYELSFYDTQAAALIGLNEDFIASARLDNLLSCYIGLQALIADDSQNSVLVCNDHEEVGSTSAVGANGPMLKSVLQRILVSDKDLSRSMDQSMIISADNAHGLHPNFADRHDGNHGPRLNAGPVIKMNANQRYATNSDTSSLFKHWCDVAGEPVQSFVVRTDLGCGSTIGPITASELGVKTLDIGVPTFAMHSIRELAGSCDGYSLYRVFQQFLAATDVGVKAV
ncbi:M18 family aminopeptidase [Oceanicoccus sp. KOV_DT_Chl]|uniref:M18 family aminopeptidase n=1 Tax=Oceanicoccus sp. KOV_DT_Chl TaxID=1904639 RepID=UPI000C7E5F09|nr:M18 family aminopeptidase [Oceanicoccus sp. KOV_DT_Chl]